MKATVVSVHLRIYLRALKFTNKLSSSVARETVAELTTSLAYPFIFYSFFYFNFSFSMNSTPIYQYAKPTSTSLKPQESSDPIITPSYELRLYFIKLIRDKSFSGEGNENPYSCLWEFEQTYACLRIAGMSDKIVRWKLFLFSLTGRAKHWYSLTIGSMQGDWKMLCSKFCLRFFPISKVVSLQKEVLNFRQQEEESLSTSWDCFNDLIITVPDLAIQDPVLLQYF